MRIYIINGDVGIAGFTGQKTVKYALDSANEITGKAVVLAFMVICGLL